MKRATLLVLAGGAALVGAFLAIGPERIWERIGGPADQGPADLDRLARRTTPNDALACTPGLCRAPAELELRVFPQAPEALIEAVERAALADPDVRRVDDRTRPLYRRFVALTPVLRFPDTVDAEARPVEGGAGLILYSRSLLGRGDAGANRDRLRDWIARLDE